MYTAVRQYRCDPAAVADIAHRADEEFADRLAEQDGFVGYEMVDCGDGTMFTLTVFTDRESAERSNELAAEFVRSRLGDFDIERTGAHIGEVRVNRAQQSMLELVHA